MGAVINGYPDYTVTPSGEIYSFKYKTPKRLKTHITRRGYERVGLCKDGKQKLFFVHDIVAHTFVPNPSNKPYVNHKNEDKTDNRADNLEWCTVSENNRYGTRLVRIAESKKKKIVQLDFLGNVIQIWNSQTDAANNLGLDKRNINQCLNGKRKRCGGFEWRYFND